MTFTDDAKCLRALAEAYRSQAEAYGHQAREAVANSNALGFSDDANAERALASLRKFRRDGANRFLQEADAARRMAIVLTNGAVALEKIDGRPGETQPSRPEDAPPRTDEEILAEANQLCHTIAANQGYSLPPTQKFYDHDARPEERQIWSAVRAAFLQLRATDLDDALSGTDY